MSDWTGDTKLLALIDSGVSFNSMSSLMAKHLDWVIKSNKSPIVVNLANGKVVRSSHVASGLVSSGVWQAYMTLLVLNVPFKVILAMLWLLHICP